MSKDTFEQELEKAARARCEIDDVDPDATPMLSTATNPFKKNWEAVADRMRPNFVVPEPQAKSA